MILGRRYKVKKNIDVAGFIIRKGTILTLKYVDNEYYQSPGERRFHFREYKFKQDGKLYTVWLDLWREDYIERI